MEWSKAQQYKELFANWQEAHSLDSKILKFDKGRGQVYYRLGKQAEAVKTDPAMTQHGSWLILLQFLGMKVATVNHARRIFKKWGENGFDALAGKTLSEADLGPEQEKKELKPAEKAMKEAKDALREKFGKALKSVDTPATGPTAAKVKALLEEVGVDALLQYACHYAYVGIVQVKIKGSSPASATANDTLEETK